MKSAVDGWAGDREDFGEVADAVVSGVVHTPQFTGLSGGEIELLSAKLSLGAGDSHPLRGGNPAMDQWSCRVRRHQRWVRR